MRSPEPVNPAPCKNAAMPIPFLIVPVCILFCEALFLGLIVGEGQRPIEKFFQIDGFTHDLFRGCRLPRLQKVSLANLDRRKPDNLRDAIHVALQRKQTLWSAEAAKSPVGRGIRGHGLGCDPDAGPVISAAGMDGAARKHYRGKGGVGSAVDREFNFAAQNLSIFTHRRAMACPRRMPLGGGRHVFHAVVNEFHRSSTLDCQQRSVRRDHRGIFFFPAESPAGLHLHDANFVGRQAAQCHQSLVNIVRTLQ